MASIHPQSLEPREVKLDLSPGLTDRNRWSHEQNQNNKITAYKLHQHKIWYINHGIYMWRVDPGDDRIRHQHNLLSTKRLAPWDQHQANQMLDYAGPLTTQRMSADATPVKRHVSESWISCFDATLKTNIRLIKFQMIETWFNEIKMVFF